MRILTHTVLALQITALIAGAWVAGMLLIMGGLWSLSVLARFAQSLN